jgi:hypothetical protein
MKVNTFIVGAPKAGTSSLHFYLNQHPEICMSSVKEPNFFSAKEVENLYYNSQIITSTNDYNSLFESNVKIKGESSVSYLYYREVAKRIYEYNAEAKIIIMLRKPAERLFSHYLMDKRLGLCSVSLQEIYDNRVVHSLFFQQFFSLGNYSEQIKKYQEFFDKSQVLILFYDDLKSDIESEVDKVFSFLGVEKKEVDLQVKNQMLVTNNLLLSALYKYRFFRKFLRFVFPSSLVKAIKKTFFNSKNKDKLSLSELKMISNYYEDEISNLEVLINKDLSAWKK